MFINLEKRSSVVASLNGGRFVYIGQKAVEATVAHEKYCPEDGKYRIIYKFHQKYWEFQLEVVWDPVKGDEFERAVLNYERKCPGSIVLPLIAPPVYYRRKTA